MRWGINKEVKRNLIKDVIVAIVCILLYAGLILFIVTPSGFELFSKLKSWLPFIELAEGTLSDINRLLGMVFEKMGLGITPDSTMEAFADITLASVMLDLSKLILSAFIQSGIFILFSKLFLYTGKSFTAKNPITGCIEEFFISDILQDGHYKDILYYLNSTLLLSISTLIGGFTGSWLIKLVSDLTASLTVGMQHLASIFLFLVLYILFSMCFMLRSRKSLGTTYSFGRSLIKTVVFNILPELMTFFVTNLILVFLFHCATTLGMHIATVSTLFVFLVWIGISQVLEALMARLFTLDLPFCGKHCPISGLLWLPASVTVIALIYIMALPNIFPNAYTYSIEYLMSRLPFVTEWMQGLSPLDAILYNFDLYTTDLLNLLLLCTFTALLQYLSSSYFATLFTQIIARALIILGIGFVVILAFHAILIWACPPIAESINYTYAAIVLGSFVYILFVVLQPYLALQGILTATCLIIIMHFIPSVTLWNSGNFDVDFPHYLGGALIMIGADLLLALLQNIASFIEKKTRKIKSAAKAVAATITG